jgi:hypothetical protein
LEIHAILRETLGEHAPSHATIKNWVAQFKRGDFSTFIFLVGLRTSQYIRVTATDFHKPGQSYH